MECLSKPVRLVGTLFLALLLAFAAALTGAAPAEANVLSDWTLTVDLQADGSAQVTERRVLNVDEGTEAFIALGHLQGAEISDFWVAEDGQRFEDMGTDWDVEASREDKAQKSGMVLKDDGVELCWGLGADGSHTYEVHYTVHGMVRQMTDGQSMYWTFYNSDTNTPPEKALMRLSAPFPMTADNTKIWGFGFGGNIHFADDGSVQGQSDTPLTSDNHITLLFQFPEAPFQTALKTDQSLADQEEQAKEGSSYGAGDADEASGTSRDGLLDLFLTFIPVALIFVAFVFPRFRRSNRKGEGNPFHIDVADVRKRTKDKYWRDIPYEGPLEDIIALLTPFKMGGIEEVFNAYLLTWLAEGRVRHDQVERGRLRKREETTMVLINDFDGPRAMRPLEERFYQMVRQAAGADGVLESREFARWSRDRFGELDGWVDSLNRHSHKTLVEDGYAANYESRRGPFKSTRLGLTESGALLTDKIISFKNYLEDFTLLDEREINEVGLWQSLLIWAGLFGIADEVAKALEDLYPDLARQMDYSYTDVLLMNQFSSGLGQAYRNAAIADAAAEATASMGGGGGTSFGGGGGSFGGGGGGGTR